MGVPVPVGVEDGSRVSAEEWNLVRRSTALVDGDNGKRAAAAGFPVDGNVLGIGLCRVSAKMPWSRAWGD
jgi:hypothetical protein